MKLGAMSHNNTPQGCLPTLPDHVIIDNILRRIPVKAVGRCRCVCKSWRTLLRAKEFVNTHLQCMSNPGSKGIIINNYPTRISFCTLFLAKDMRRLVFNWFDHPPENGFTSLEGTCNGLLLSLHQIDCSRPSSLLLFNPITSRTVSIPYFGHAVIFGLGFDETQKDYKILAVTLEVSNLILNMSIYSVKARTWRSLGQSPYQYFRHGGLGPFMNGAMHFPAAGAVGGCYQLVAFNLDREEFSEIPFPKDLTPPDMFSWGEINMWVEIRGCLAMLMFESWDVFAVWVMVEYGNQDSWLKYEIPISHWQTYLRVIEEDIILFKTQGKTLVGYHLNNGIVEVLGLYDDEHGEDGTRNLLPQRTSGFGESLVSPVHEV